MGSQSAAEPTVLTDLYEVTMALSYVREGMTGAGNV